VRAARSRASRTCRRIFPVYAAAAVKRVNLFSRWDNPGALDAPAITPTLTRRGRSKLADNCKITIIRGLLIAICCLLMRRQTRRGYVVALIATIDDLGTFCPARVTIIDYNAPRGRGSSLTGKVTLSSRPFRIIVVVVVDGTRDSPNGKHSPRPSRPFLASAISILAPGDFPFFPFPFLSFPRGWTVSTVRKSDQE